MNNTALAQLYYTEIQSRLLKEQTAQNFEEKRQRTNFSNINRKFK